jgi:hypothetical protein
MALVSTQLLTETSSRNLPGGVNGGRRIRLTTFPPFVSQLSKTCGSFDVSQPYEPSRPVTGIAVLFFFTKNKNVDNYCLQREIIMGSGTYLQMMCLYLGQKSPFCPECGSILFLQIVMYYYQTAWHHIPEESSSESPLGLEIYC